ncbi:hypothetical protein P9D54_22070 [Bacillus haynesii]|uniref:hypothetical protein n=1 Tax=Bacillus haynesii TaxID=1925021 RepID=UPI002DBC8492|nr:hypothetical protein [Bacillus haynesii]MEC1348034.1 hypothetical protein [Bacillus haynesii]
MVRNQAAQAAGMSQAGGRGQEKQPAIGPGSGKTVRGKRGALLWSGTRHCKLQE